MHLKLEVIANSGVLLLLRLFREYISTILPYKRPSNVKFNQLKLGQFKKMNFINFFLLLYFYNKIWIVFKNMHNPPHNLKSFSFYSFSILITLLGNSFLVTKIWKKLKIITEIEIFLRICGNDNLIIAEPRKNLDYHFN